MPPTAFLHPFARTGAAADHFLTIVRGDGALVYDTDGNAYVDGMGSLWYANAGHGRTEIADAAAEQMRTLAAYHTFDRFTNEPTERLCGMLVERCHVPDTRVFLCSSGSEAVDSALKLARLTHALRGEPERTVVIARLPSYHGVTYGGLTLTGLPANQEHYGPLLPDVVQVPYDDADAVRAAMTEHTGRVAAVIGEPVIGAGGVYPPPEGYWPQLRRLCDEHGALLIADEVICAFGRLGRWWGSEHYGVRPDLMTFAKGVTSGYVPLGGVVVGRVVRDALEADPDFLLRHGHTYSGHPAAAAAAIANLEVTEKEGLLERARAVGERLAAGLRELQRDGLLAEVRGAGAVWAAGLHEDLDAPTLREHMLADGVVTRPIGTSTLAFCPPLVITDAQVDQCVEAVGAAVRAARA